MDISKIKRILIVRTDRIGDVVLSMPVMKAVRLAFPDSYIAMMVPPRVSELIETSPYINEVIVFDRKKHKGILKTLNFIRCLRSKKFDIALILHSTKRINLICFLADIPIRVGYARGKMDFLLTDRLEYKKRLGEKHESEYSLDILRHLGINAAFSRPEIPVKKLDKEKIEEMLKTHGINPGERFIILHPGASCISKMWPCENFAEAGDILIKEFNIKVMINLAPQQADIGENVKALMKHKPIFLCDPMTLGELAALLERASLLISNDSGPVHIACAVNTPVVDIFGRNQKGLSPARWGPLGDKSIAIHKDVGCTECLAHDCKKGFLCLKAISVGEVIGKVKAMMTGAI